MQKNIGIMQIRAETRKTGSALMLLLTNLISVFSVYTKLETLSHFQHWANQGYVITILKIPVTYEF